MNVKAIGLAALAAVVAFGGLAWAGEGADAGFPAWRPRRAPPLGLPADTVVVIIDGDSITADRYYAALPADLGEMPEDEAREIRRGVLENIVMLHIIDQRLAKTGTRVASADIDAELAPIVTAMLADEAEHDHGHASADEFLQAHPDQVREIRRQLALAMAFRNYLDTVFANETATPEKRAAVVAAARADIETRYAAVSGIFAEDPKKIEMAQKLLAAGDAFEDVAKALSEDKETAPLGGDLGAVPYYQLGEFFTGQIPALKVGEISGSMLTPRGTAIFRKNPLTDELVLHAVQDEFYGVQRRRLSEKWLSEANVRYVR